MWRSRSLPFAAFVECMCCHTSVTLSSLMQCRRALLSIFSLWCFPSQEAASVSPASCRLLQDGFKELWWRGGNAGHNSCEASQRLCPCVFSPSRVLYSNTTFGSVVRCRRQLCGVVWRLWKWSSCCSYSTGSFQTAGFEGKRNPVIFGTSNRQVWKSSKRICWMERTQRFLSTCRDWSSFFAASDSIEATLRNEISGPSSQHVSGQCFEGFAGLNGYNILPPNTP